MDKYPRPARRDTFFAPFVRSLDLGDWFESSRLTVNEIEYAIARTLVARGEIPMQQVAGGVLVLVLIGSAMVAEGSGQDKPATPAEQYKTLLKEYNRASSSGVPLT